MTKRRCCKYSHVDPQIVMSLALVRYHFSTPEIRLLMRHVLGTLSQVERLSALQDQLAAD